MGTILTKWSVLREHTVTDDDLDASGAVHDNAVKRWAAGARSEYLDGCVALKLARERADLLLRDLAATFPPGALLGRPASLLVTASAPEIRPTSFTIAVRLRPLGGDREIPVTAYYVVRLEDAATGEAQPLGDEIRDELIAIERAAQHYN